jgi:serine protease
MRFCSLLIAAVLGLSSNAIAAPPQAHPTRITNKTRVIAGHLLVKPTQAKATATATTAFVSRLSAQLGVTLTVKRELMLGWLLLEAAGVDDEDATLVLVDRATKVPGVDLAAAEWVWRAFATPSDPFFEFMWHLDAIGARQAWDITQGRSQNLVGVVDTGTAFSHEDLQGKRAREFDFIDDTFQSADGDGRDDDATDVGDAADCDGNGQLDGESSFHGTHVAGTILANGDNNIGVTGVNWNGRLVTGRALGRCGGTTVDIDTAVAWMAGFQIDGVPSLAANERPRVVNLSLGATGAPCDQFTNDIWNQVVAQGVVIVVAAGNDAAPVASPANCPASLAVAAFGPNGGNQLATYSNFGGEIDIVAPGGDQGRTGVFEDGVLSSIDPSVSPFQNGEPYTFFQGTSMAAPHVAGVISLMLDVNGGLSVDDVTDLLKSASGTCTDCQGKPALRADLAVAAAAGTEVSTQPGDSCAGTAFCSPGQTCAPLNSESICQTSCDVDGDCGANQSCASLTGGGGVCVNAGEGEGEEGEGEAPAGECDPRRGNLDCDAGDHCEEDDGVTSCERGEGDVGVGGLCDLDDDCSTGLCDRGVCTVTCDGEACRDGYSCSDEDDSGVPGGLCRADSCLEDPSICEDAFDCSYSSDSRYVCAAGPSNYRGFCGSQPGAWAPIPAIALVILAMRRRTKHAAAIASR